MNDDEATELCPECREQHNPWRHHSGETVWKAQERRAIAMLLRQRAAVIWNLAVATDPEQPEYVGGEIADELVSLAEGLEKARKK